MRRLSLREEGTVSLPTNFGERAGRRCQRIGFEDVVADLGGPLHLRLVADEFASETAINRVDVADVHPLVDAAPNDPERHRSCWQRRRWRAEQRIDDVAIIENRHIEPAQGGAAFAQFDLDAVLGQLDRPQQAQWWKSTRVEVVDLSRCLIARTEL